jgi:hypothetical protein
VLADSIAPTTLEAVHALAADAPYFCDRGVLRREVHTMYVCVSIE